MFSLSLSRPFQCGSSSPSSVCRLCIWFNDFLPAATNAKLGPAGVGCGVALGAVKSQTMTNLDALNQAATMNYAALQMHRWKIEEATLIDVELTMEGNRGGFVTQVVLFQSRTQQWNFDSLIGYLNRLRCYRMCRILRYLPCLSIMPSHEVATALDAPVFTKM